MQTEQADAAWLDAHHEFSSAELVRCSGMSETDLRELVDCGALVPNNPQGAEWTFGADIVVSLRTAGRLRADLELEPQALALAFTLISRIRALEAQLGELRAQLPRRSR